MIIKKNKNNRDEVQQNQQIQEEVVSEEINPDIVFDISDIDFNSRMERRQGDRRRGYRRIDDRSLVSRAQQESISIKSNAKAEGYKEGLQKAENDIANLSDSINNFLNAKEQMYDEVSSRILDISLEVAKKIIKKEIETNQDVLKDIIINALDKLTKNEKQIILKVSPFDRDYVKLNIESILSQLQIEAKVTVQQDMTLIQGSVVIETNNGLIDASITTGLQVVEQMFKNMQGD